MSEPRELSLIADGARLLAEARDLFEVQQVIGLAKAAVAYARAKDLGEDAVRSANRIVILATLRLGQELVAGRDRGEIATAGEPISQMSKGATSDLPATLADLGISRDLSSTAQRFARNVQAIVDYAHRADMPSQAGALRMIAQESNDEYDKFAGSLIDPETKDRHALAKAAAMLLVALDAIESIGRPPTEAEAAPMLPTLSRLQQKLHGKRTARLEVVS